MHPKRDELAARRRCSGVGSHLDTGGLFIQVDKTYLSINIKITVFLSDWQPHFIKKVFETFLKKGDRVLFLFCFVEKNTENFRHRGHKGHKGKRLTPHLFFFFTFVLFVTFVAFFFQLFFNDFNRTFLFHNPQRQSRLIVQLTLKRRPLEFLDEDFARKDDCARREVPAEGSPGGVRQRYVGVNKGFTVFQGNIPHQRRDFHGLIEFEEFVGPRVLVVIADAGFLHRADGFDTPQADVLLGAEGV